MEEGRRSAGALRCPGESDGANVNAGGAPAALRVPVIPIGKHAGGAPPPFFFAAAAVKHLQHLHAQGLPRPLYGMLPASFAGDSEAPGGAGQLGRHYVEAIMAKQPRGPYALGGYCMFGLVALEAAQQLIAAGERVEVLALVSTIDPDLLPQRVTPISEILGWERPSPLDHPAVQDVLAATTPLRRDGTMSVAEVVERVMPAVRTGLQEQLSGYSLDLVAELFEASLWTTLLAVTYRHRPYPGRISYVYNERGVNGDGLAATELRLSERSWRAVAEDGFDCFRFDKTSTRDAEETPLSAPEFVTYLRQRLSDQAP
jgi:thioesterase domain-containing protein